MKRLIAGLHRDDEEDQSDSAAREEPRQDRHEVWCSTVIEQGEVADGQAAISQGPDHGCSEKGLRHHQIAEAIACQERS